MSVWGRCATVVALAVGLSGCVEDWLGHPATRAQQPERLTWQTDEATQQLIDAVRAELPPVVVDHAVFVSSAPAESGWLAPLRRRIWDDATDAAGAWPDAYVTRLHRLTRATASPALIDTWRFVLADAPTPLDGWPARWQMVFETPDRARRWLRDADAPAGEPPAEQIWVDLRDASEPVALLQRASAMAAADQAVFLVGCMTAGMARWQSCLQWLRQLPSAASAFVLLDTPTTIAAAPDVLISVLQQVDLYGRYRYASAYPSPAINTRISLDWLAFHDVLDRADIEPLRTLYAHNPLLFDLALKRRLRLPGTDLRLPAAVFGPAAATVSGDG